MSAAVLGTTARPAAAQEAPETSVALVPADSSRNVVRPASAAVLPLTIEAATDQSQPLTRWRAATGDPLLEVTPRGDLHRRHTSSVHGPWTWEAGLHDFPGQPARNPVSYWGYNIGDGGNPVRPGEPYAGYVVEADYFNGTTRLIEMYWEARNAANTENVRPFSANFRREATTREGFCFDTEVTGNPVVIRAVRNSGDAILATFRPYSTDLLALAGADNSLQLRAGDNYNAHVVLHRGPREIARWQTASDTQAELKVRGQPVRFYAVNNASAVVMAVNAAENGAVGTFAVGNGFATTKGLVVRGRSDQRAALVEVQDAAKNVRGGFDRTGTFFTAVNTAPADADVAAGQCFLWFDAGNGKPALRVKARSLNGSLVTGSLGLS